MHFKCPADVNGVSIDHQQFDADDNGVIEAPERFKQRLIELGFTATESPTKPTVAEEEVAHTDFSPEELAELEAETEKLKTMTFPELGEYLVGKRVDIKILNTVEKRLNVALELLGKKVA